MDASITKITAHAYKIPTEEPEGDGTIEWDSTTLVVVHAEAGGKTGLGYTYGAAACAALVNDFYAKKLAGLNALDIPAALHKMQHAARNIGFAGPAAYAAAAIDTALWDLKAKLLDVSLIDLWGCAQESVAVYGSGGFTTYDGKKVAEQIAGWLDQGITMAKIKIGAHPDQDMERVASARDALGDKAQLFVDANGAYNVKQALDFAEQFADFGVRWFEEPVSSDNLDGLHLLRERGPAGMDIAAGEYAQDWFTLKRLLDAQAVDVLQIDATRCLGYSGFIHGASLALAHNIPVSSHCAPALHLPVCCHTPHTVHMEYFADHVRIEHMLFDGVPDVTDGRLAPDRRRPGHGLSFKAKDAEKYAV